MQGCCRYYLHYQEGMSFLHTRDIPQVHQQKQHGDKHAPSCTHVHSNILLSLSNICSTRVLYVRPTNTFFPFMQRACEMNVICAYMWQSCDMHMHVWYVCMHIYKQVYLVFFLYVYTSKTHAHNVKVMVAKQRPESRWKAKRKLNAWQVWEESLGNETTDIHPEITNPSILARYRL